MAYCLEHQNVQVLHFLYLEVHSDIFLCVKAIESVRRDSTLIV